jgi:hypothetical protein
MIWRKTPFRALTTDLLATDYASLFAFWKFAPCEQALSKWTSAILSWSPDVGVIRHLPSARYNTLFLYHLLREDCSASVLKFLGISAALQGTSVMSASEPLVGLQALPLAWRVQAAEFARSSH